MAGLIAEHPVPSGHTLALVQGDLTRSAVEAIVNAANGYLKHGGGLAAAIARAGGDRVQQESDRWVRDHGPARYDRPAVTGAGNLPFRYIVHAVGPVWGEGDEDRKLSLAVSTSLGTAADLGVSSLGVPAISTGIFGFPKERAAPIILGSSAQFLIDHPRSALRRVEITILDAPTLAPFREAFARLFEASAPGGAL